MADDKIRGGDPEKRKKKPAAKAPADDDEEERPRKKKRPADEEDEDAPKRKKRRKDNDDEPDDSGSSALSAILPVGGSIFALLSLWLSVLSLVLGIASAKLFWASLLSVLLPAMWPIAILCGLASFFTHKSKASYGSITGNMRAILGILIGLAAMALHAFLAYIFFADPPGFR